jgi:hypothetical protein
MVLEEKLLIIIFLIKHKNPSNLSSNISEKHYIVSMKSQKN